MADTDSSPAAPPPSRGAWLLRVLVLVLVFLPAIWTARSVRENAVNIPVWDGWERGKLLQRAFDGTLDFEFLYSAHIDHRMPMPRLATLALNGLSGGDLRAEIWAIYAMLLVTGACLFYLLAKTLADWRWAATCGFLVNLVVFSPVQYQNLLWPVQLAYVLPVACLAIILAVMRSGLPPWAKFVTILVACLIGCHSFGHGLILWPVAILLGLLQRQTGSLRTRCLFGGGMTLACVLVVVPYFTWNYVNTSEASHAFGREPGESPPAMANRTRVFENAKSRERFANYFRVTLGNPWARVFQSKPMEAALKLGFWLFLGFLVLGGTVLFRWRETIEWDQLLPWAALGCFSAATAFLQALGRSAVSWDRAILPRYITTSMLLGIALIVVAAWLLHRRRLPAAALALGALLAGMQVASWDYGLHKMKAWRQARLQERFALIYLDQFDTAFGTRLDKDVEFVRRQARFLDAQGWLDPPMAKALDWGPFVPAGKDLPQSRADLFRARLTADGKLAIEGYAEFGGDGNRPADGVLLTYRTGKNAEWTVFGLAEQYGIAMPRGWVGDGEFAAPKPSFSKVKNTAKWARVVPLDALPESGEVEIKAWAVNTDKLNARGIARTLRLDRSSTPPGELHGPDA